jgi:hypothetical protein
VAQEAEISSAEGAGELSQPADPPLLCAPAAPTEAAGSACVRGATFLAASGDLTLPWLAGLGDFFSVGGGSGGDGFQAPPPALDLDIHLQVHIIISAHVLHCLLSLA